MILEINKSVLVEEALSLGQKIGLGVGAAGLGLAGVGAAEHLYGQNVTGDALNNLNKLNHNSFKDNQITSIMYNNMDNDLSSDAQAKLTNYITTHSQEAPQQKITWDQYIAENPDNRITRADYDKELKKYNNDLITKASKIYNPIQTEINNKSHGYYLQRHGQGKMIAGGLVGAAGLGTATLLNKNKQTQNQGK